MPRAIFSWPVFFSNGLSNAVWQACFVTEPNELVLPDEIFGLQDSKNDTGSDSSEIAGWESWELYLYKFTCRYIIYIYMELYLLIYNDVFYFVSFCWCIIWVLDVYTYLCLYCMFIHWCVYVYVYIFRCSPVPGGQWPPGLYLLVREDPSKPVFASRWWNIYIYIYVYYTDMDCWTTFQK